MIVRESFIQQSGSIGHVNTVRDTKQRGHELHQGQRSACLASLPVDSSG